MKQVKISFFLMLISLFSFAQSPVNLGIKVGTNSSSLITNLDDFFDKSQINHYLVGAFARINLNRVYIQPEVYFNTKGGILTSEYSNTVIPDFSKIFSYQTIDIPILIGYHIVKKPIFNFRANIGPVLQYVTTKPIIEDISNFNVDELKDNYIGIQAGIGFDLWFISIDARVENSFNIFINNSSYSAANRVYLISAGIKLF